MGAAGRVAIVGAGYAGMAAAVTLAENGVVVAVFEAGPVPGGRARRVRARGRELDNGQHILIGAYSTLLGLMRRVGVPSDAVLRVPLELRYADGFAMRSLWLPAPLGLLGGLAFARGIPLGERLGAVRFMRALAAAGWRVSPDCSVAELLARHRQDGRAGHYLWRPLCVSALNTPTELASAQVFVTVLRDSLGRGDEACDLLLPRVDLSQLFPDRGAEFLRERGGTLKLSCPVRALSADLRVEGESYSHVILAVGPHQLKPFAALVGPLPAYAYQPIYTCYLQYAPAFRLPFPMLGLSGGLVQWAFDRGQLSGKRGLVSCMISAQGEHQQLTHQALEATCHRELARACPGLPDLQWSQTIAEKRATISCAPGIARPGWSTATPRLYLAGDYTDPDYPPTLEAAARSGVRAAQRVLAS